jgi:peroxin-6
MQNGWKLTGFPVAICGTTSEPRRVPMTILSSFKHEVAFEASGFPLLCSFDLLICVQAPSEGARREILSCLLANDILAPDVSLSALAIQTAALVASDLADFVARTKSTSIERVIRIT